jgi:uncharacterized damage-inducible protein DinB
MKLAATLILCVAGLSAQTNTTTTSSPKNPLVATSQAIFGIAKSDILRSADKIPDDLWSFQPTPDVRTVGQLFAHVADAQYEFCGTVAEGKAPEKDIEKTAKTKTEIVTALKEAFAYCDAAYTKMTDASAAQITTFFGRKVTQIGLMDFNVAHTMEHYGNLVTYMRLKGIVPPSSEAQK